MKKLASGQKIEATAYKHNGEMHRKWRSLSVIEHQEDVIIFANKFAKVLEGNGKNWFTPEPAVSFFYNDKFFNVIAMLKDDGIYFYCNLSSPALIDDEVLKYIDYDLDVRVKPDFSYEIVDQDEYRENIEKYNYSEDLKEVIQMTLDDLIIQIKNKELPFDHKYIEDLYFKFAVNMD